jgi:hypothetical protein
LPQRIGVGGVLFLWYERSGQPYEHRRQWLEDRILLLASVFAIDFCAYAVMSNRKN